MSCYVFHIIIEKCYLNDVIIKDSTACIQMYVQKKSSLALYLKTVEKEKWIDNYIIKLHKCGQSA